MSIAELLLIFIVAAVVIGPKRLPEVAYYLGKFFRFLRSSRDQAEHLFDHAVKEQELLKNIERAEKAEAKDTKDVPEHVER